MLNRACKELMWCYYRHAGNTPVLYRQGIVMITKQKTVAVVAAPTVVKGGKAAPGLIKVLKADAKLRGGSARAAWYAALCKYDGKPAAEFLVATKDKPPSVPKSGVAEKPTGW